MKWFSAVSRWIRPLSMRAHSRLDGARNDVERPSAVDVLTFRVDRERDAHLDDRPLGVRLPFRELANAERSEVIGQLAQRTGGPCPGCEELVVEPARLVLIPVDAHRFGSPTDNKTRNTLDETVHAPVLEHQAGAEPLTWKPRRI